MVNKYDLVNVISGSVNFPIACNWLLRLECKCWWLYFLKKNKKKSEHWNILIIPLNVIFILIRLFR